MCVEGGLSISLVQAAPPRQLCCLTNGPQAALPQSCIPKLPTPYLPLLRDFAEMQTLSQQVWRGGLSSQAALPPLVVLTPACPFESPWDHFRNTSAQASGTRIAGEKVPSWASFLPIPCGPHLGLLKGETDRQAAVRRHRSASMDTTVFL